MKKVLSIGTINKSVLAAEYAVRGPIAVRAEALKRVIPQMSPIIMIKWVI